MCFKYELFVCQIRKSLTHPVRRIKLEMFYIFQIKHLHTLGVTSLQCPAKVSKKTVLLVESVLTADSDNLPGVEKSRRGLKATRFSFLDSLMVFG